HHTGGAQFAGKKATLVGHDASIDVTDSDSNPQQVNISDGSSIVIRNVSVNEHLTMTGSDFSGVIQASTSELTVDNMQGNTLTRFAISADKITIRNSEFNGFALQAARVVADRCIFHTGGPWTTGSIELTNSIIHTDPTGVSISIHPAVGTQF